MRKLGCYTSLEIYIGGGILESGICELHCRRALRGQVHVVKEQAPPRFEAASEHLGLTNRQGMVNPQAGRPVQLVV